jgi:hypothetical protein
MVFPAALWGGWVSETVADDGDVGTCCSLAVDRWGRPHITYFDKTNSKVVYAKYINSEWEFEDVAKGVEVSGNTALALDAFDRPHVMFTDDAEYEMTYAYLSGGNWTTEVVETGEGYGLRVSIAAWPSGPHISYTYAVSMSVNLKYAYRDSGEWKKETVAGGGLFNKIMVDAQAKPHIIDYYADGSDLVVRHNVYDGEEWSDEDLGNGVDSDATQGPDGKIHVSFAKNDNTALYYVYENGTDWATETVGAAKGAPAFTQICVNGNKDVFISYFNFDGSDLNVVMKKGSTWTHDVVATGAYVGLPHSIALGPDGYPFIAYYDGTNHSLKLARYDPLTDVELTSFTADRSRAAVEVRWAVTDDEGVAGYNLYRSSADEGRAQVNPSLITGTSPYRYRDPAVRAEKSYEYWLEVVPHSGAPEEFGPASVPPAALAKAVTLYQNSPNPVSAATTFSFELPAATDVTLALYDAAGRKVATVADGHFAAGRHDLSFEAGLPAGVYVYRLETAAEAYSKKMVVAPR